MLAITCTFLAIENGKSCHYDGVEHIKYYRKALWLLIFTHVLQMFRDLYEMHLARSQTTTSGVVQCFLKGVWFYNIAVYIYI